MPEAVGHCQHLVPNGQWCSPASFFYLSSAGHLSFSYDSSFPVTIFKQSYNYLANTIINTTLKLVGQQFLGTGEPDTSNFVFPRVLPFYSFLANPSSPSFLRSDFPIYLFSSILMLLSCPSYSLGCYWVEYYPFPNHLHSWILNMKTWCFCRCIYLKTSGWRHLNVRWAVVADICLKPRGRDGIDWSWTPKRAWLLDTCINKGLISMHANGNLANPGKC